MVGLVCTVIFGKASGKRQTATETAASVKTAVAGKNQTNEKTEAASDAAEKGSEAGSDVVLKAPVIGEILPVTESSDPTFAQKLLGDGIVVRTEDTQVKVMAPCDGTVKFVYPGGHAAGIETKNGTGILIHCGVDTVKLNGEGFTIRTEEGRKVSAGDVLLEFDRKTIEEKGYSSEVIMLVTDKPENCTVKVEGLRDCI